MRARIAPWSPLLVQQIELRALGFVLHTLRLNRHRETEVKEHHHSFDQLILYVSGQGWQTLDGVRHQAGPGDLFLIPPGIAHGFGQEGRSRPVCLVLDFESGRGGRPLHRRLPPAEVDELRRLLAAVPTKGRLRLAHYPIVLEVVARLLEPSPRTASPPADGPPDWLRLVRAQAALRSAPGEIARVAGYHRDHLTRKLKQKEGLGLRALRDRHRLAVAMEALRAGAKVGDAAAAAGFDDQNYFARWFKKRTNQTPSAAAPHRSQT